MDHQARGLKIPFLYATVAELADALDLGSSLYEVGVQVSSVAPNDTNPNFTYMIKRGFWGVWIKI